MTLETQISLMTVPQEFCRLCNAILRAQHGEDFLAIDDDQADAGNDGYLKSERRMYAMHCFKRAQNQSIERLIRRKMVGDLGKAIALKRAAVWDVGAWTFISNYPVNEGIAAEIVRIGDEAGVDASWLGPAELAVQLQAQPSARDHFPALQVNEVSERLGQIHETVLDLAHELSPQPIEFAGLPQTTEEQAQLIATKPPYWEYLLFVGALVQGQEAVEFAYLDHKLGISGQREKVDFADTLDILGGTSDRTVAAIDPINRIFEADSLERAFGSPGEPDHPGDVKAIQHLAHVVTEMYEELLGAAAQLRAVEPPRLLRHAVELAIRQYDRPIELVRCFVAKARREMEKLPEYLASGGADGQDEIVVTLALVLDVDEGINREYLAEMERVGRKVRRRNWTGLNVDER